MREHVARTVRLLLEADLDNRRTEREGAYNDPTAVIRSAIADLRYRQHLGPMSIRAWTNLIQAADSTGMAIYLTYSANYAGTPVVYIVTLQSVQKDYIRVHEVMVRDLRYKQPRNQGVNTVRDDGTGNLQIPSSWNITTYTRAGLNNSLGDDSHMFILPVKGAGPTPRQAASAIGLDGLYPPKKESKK